MGTLTGTGILARHILRRDRLILPLWGFLSAVYPMSIANSTVALYPTADLLRPVAQEAMANPAQLATRGVVFDAGAGGMTAWTVGSSGAMLMGLVSMLLVIRHTRVDEESGRSELIGSGVVGRQAPPAAALGVVCSVNLLIGALMSVLLMGTGLPAAGSLALGLALAAAGCTFAAVGAVAAQVTESAVSARGLGVSVFIAFFLIRAVGDASGAHWLSWLSPLGWTLNVRPFAGERWWVAALLLAFIALLAVAAHMLSARRDLAAGLLPPRLGPAAAAPGLRSPLALAWRLHRGQVVAWTAGFAVAGLTLGGAVSGNLEGQLNSPQIMDMIARVGGEDARPADFFLNFLLSMLAWIVATSGMLSALRLRSEESAGRADLVLVTPVSRVRWALSHLVVALAGPALVLAALGVTAGLGYSLTSGDIGKLPQVLAGALAYLPAVWVMTGIAAALAGLLPRFAMAAWGIWVGFILIDVFGMLGQVNANLLEIIPFVHIPWVLLGQMSPAPLAVLTAVAAALTAAGVAGLRRRDLVA
ncbi:ABC transporter permease [Sinosporangium siamense]|uniref:Exporter of polyketide antibiotics n=1 Tax=Sinosporangium siamense TaxID=1367973 RepID=A0A919RLY2_9ACTN|nr:ABC transporter permease [Sinosporangium siamense]GII96193.1 exporter of polyketide antibiotics [Sinosporangium siamense]